MILHSCSAISQLLIRHRLTSGGKGGEGKNPYLAWKIQPDINSRGQFNPYLYQKWLSERLGVARCAAAIKFLRAANSTRWLYVNQIFEWKSYIIIIKDGKFTSILQLS